MADERYTDALVHFNRSYELRRAASVALNLGITLRALGRLVEARSRFNEFFELASSTLRDRHDRDVSNFLADINRRISRMHVVALEPSGARITVDGRRVAVDERDEVQIDPGEHRVEATAQGFATLSRTIQVTSGGRVDVELRLQPAVAASGVTTDPRVSLTTAEANTQNNITVPTNSSTNALPTQPGGSVLRSPWLWVAIGVGVAAAVTIPAVLLTRGPNYTNYPGLFCVRTDGMGCN
jgi:hypothetical protein